jgi:hypothetical protein
MKPKRASAKALVGAKVRNASGDTVGKIEDLYVAAGGSIKTLKS